MIKLSSLKTNILIAILVTLLLTGCNQPRQFGVTPTNDGTESVATEVFVQATNTAIAKTLTATATPMAMTVNGLQYTLDEFKNDLLRFVMAFPEMGPEDAFNTLTADLSEQLILQQAAQANGFTVSEAELDQRIADLSNEIGGEEMLNNWMSSNYYNESSFRNALKREMAVAYQKSAILSNIKAEQEQAELYQILVYDEGTAKQIWQAISEGTDFFWLAKQYHPATLGYIGWSPKGAMLPPAVEEAAFSMEVGTSSEVIQTDYGYHIVYLNDLAVHELSPENMRFLQETALETWMAKEKQTAVIEIFTTYNE